VVIEKSSLHKDLASLLYNAVTQKTCLILSVIKTFSFPRPTWSDNKDDY